MRALRPLFRFYSYLVLAGVAVLGLALSIVILASPNHAVRIGWLPWTGDPLVAWLAGLGVAGVAAVTLALAGRMRWLLPLFALAVVWLVVRGLFFSPWQFAGPADFRLALWIVLGLILALFGSLTKSE